MTATPMLQGVMGYIEHIKADYARMHRELTDTDKMMIARFNERITFKEGSKYIKIISDGSAHSFIVKHDDGKYKAGDILKPASWAAPARNFARGNVLQGNWRATWTGAG